MAPDIISNIAPAFKALSPASFETAINTANIPPICHVRAVPLFISSEDNIEAILTTPTIVAKANDIRNNIAPAFKAFLPANADTAMNVVNNHPMRPIVVIPINTSLGDNIDANFTVATIIIIAIDIVNNIAPAFAAYSPAIVETPTKVVKSKPIVTITKIPFKTSSYFSDPASFITPIIIINETDIINNITPAFAICLALGPFIIRPKVLNTAIIPATHRPRTAIDLTMSFVGTSAICLIAIAIINNDKAAAIIGPPFNENPPAVSALLTTTANASKIADNSPIAFKDLFKSSSGIFDNSHNEPANIAIDIAKFFRAIDFFSNAIPLNISPNPPPISRIADENPLNTPLNESKGFANLPKTFINLLVVNSSPPVNATPIMVPTSALLTNSIILTNICFIVSVTLSVSTFKGLANPLFKLTFISFDNFLPTVLESINVFLVKKSAIAFFTSLSILGKLSLINVSMSLIAFFNALKIKAGVSSAFLASDINVCIPLPIFSK